MKIRSWVYRNKYNILFIILILCMSLGMMIFSRTESDYFWHITAGKYMVNNKMILNHDVFSWYLKGTYWMSHEWLFEIILYCFYLLFGKYSLLLFTFICLFTLLLVIYLGNRKDFLKNKAFSLLWLTFAIILDVFIVGRPHMISFILLALTVYFYKDLYDNEKSNKIYWMPLITIIWANIHGGSSNLTYILGFIFLICSLIDINVGKVESKRRNKKVIYKYIFSIILCMLCVNIGPHSFNMFIYPYQNLSDSVMINNISEWRPTVLSDNAHLPFFIFSFAVLLILLFSKKKIRLIDFMLYISMLFLGLKSIRFWAYIYIVMSFSVFYYISSREDDKGTELTMLIISAMCLFIFIINYHSIIKETNRHYLSNESISALKRENPKRLYNNYDFGGELIYNGVEVFIDGRADLYSKYNFKDAIDISNMSDNYSEMIKKYNFDYYYVGRENMIYRYLKDNGNYKKIMCDKKVCLYKKKETK